MPEQEQRGENRVPIALRIKLRFRKVDTFVSKFATNISSNGMFISSRKPKAKGTLLRFELRLADDSTVIAGQGKVAWVRQFDPDHPKRPHGMGIEFTAVSPASRDLIAQIVASRVEQGLGEADEIPFAAKQAPLPQPSKPTPAAPRVASAPSAVSQADLSQIDSSQVDLGAAVARARALVGSVELDDELEKLYRVSAAPVAETVDEASNDLARMFGGQAVRAKRIRHSDPPTGVEISAAPAADKEPEEADNEDEEAVELPDAAAVAAEAVDAVDQLLATDEDSPAEEVAVTALAAEARVADLDAENASPADGSQIVYSRALTDASPEIIAELEASDPEAQPAPPTAEGLALIAEEKMPLPRAETEHNLDVIAEIDAPVPRAATEDNLDIIAELDAPESIPEAMAAPEDSLDVVAEEELAAASTAKVDVEAALDELSAESSDGEESSKQEASLAPLGQEESFDDLQMLESENHISAAHVDAPMHLDESGDESLDIDIDEDEEPAQPAVQASPLDELEVIDTAALNQPGTSDFAEGANNTMDLTDLIDLPPTMDSMDEIDVDLD